MNDFLSYIVLLMWILIQCKNVEFNIIENYRDFEFKENLLTGKNIKIV